MADVWALGHGRVVKLYRAGARSDSAGHEAAAARLAHGSGVPTPDAVDVVTIDGRPGVVFERVDGPTVLEVIVSAPARVAALARDLARLHAEIHACGARELRGQRDRLRARIERVRIAPAGVTAAALASLDRLPDGGALCHGDFHPGNVVLTARGPVVIDWFDATRGEPAADVARTRVLVRFAAPPGAAAASAIDRVRAAFDDAYTAGYVALTALSRAAIDDWTLAVAAARLADPIPRAEYEALAALTLALTTALPGPDVPRR